MKACRYEYGITSCFVRCGALPGEDCLPWLRSKPEALQLFTPPPNFPSPRNSEPAQPTARGSPGEGKTTFSHKPAASPFPRQGQGRSWICSGLGRGLVLPSPPRHGRLRPHTHCPAAGLRLARNAAGPGGALPGLGSPASPVGHGHEAAPAGLAAGAMLSAGASAPRCRLPPEPVPGARSRVPDVRWLCHHVPGSAGLGVVWGQDLILFQNKRILLGRISGILVLTTLRMPQFPHP